MMTKDEMARLACITARADGMYSIYATVSPKKGLAAKISKILASESERTGESVAAVVRRALLNLRNFDEVTEQLAEALACNAHALELCDETDHALDIIDWGNDASYQSMTKKIIQDFRMALLDCPTKTNTEFTGEKSAEYIARYGEGQENA